MKFLLILESNVNKMRIFVLSDPVYLCMLKQFHLLSRDEHNKFSKNGAVFWFLSKV